MSTQWMIRNVTVISSDSGEKAQKDIFIRDDKIATIASPGSIAPPVDSQSIDGTGKYAIPGLWDMLCHALTYPEMVERTPSLLIANGITSIRMAGEPLDKSLALRNTLEIPNAVGPRLWISGPFINSSPHWGNAKSLTADTAEEAIALVDELVAAGVHMIKTYEMLRPEVFEAIVNRANDHGLKTGGHIPTRMTIEEVLDIDPDYDIFHLGGQCTGMKFDCAYNAEAWRAKRVATLDNNGNAFEKGYELLNEVDKAAPVQLSDIDSSKRDTLIELFVKKGTWHTPTLVCNANLTDLGIKDNLDRENSLRYLPQPFMQKMQDLFAPFMHILEERQQWGPWYLETVGLMHKAGVPILAGTDCPPFLDCAPGMALHFELAALVKAGLSPLAALQAATLNPAKYFGIENEFGSISEGYFADLLLLDEDPLLDINNTRKIHAVVSRGNVLTRTQLDDLLNSMTEQ